MKALELPWEHRIKMRPFLRRLRLSLLTPLVVAVQVQVAHCHLLLLQSEHARRHIVVSPCTKIRYDHLTCIRVEILFEIMVGL